MDLTPTGIAHLEFSKSGNHYVWRKVTTKVHGIILGKMYIDQVGEMDVVNHKKNIRCHIKFDATPYFGGIARKVTGTVINAQNEVCPKNSTKYKNALKIFLG